MRVIRYLSTRPWGSPVGFTGDRCPVSLPTLLSCLFKLGRKEGRKEGRKDMDEINQQCHITLVSVSIKELVRTPSVFLLLGSLIV